MLRQNAGSMQVLARIEKKGLKPLLYAESESCRNNLHPLGSVKLCGVFCRVVMPNEYEHLDVYLESRWRLATRMYWYVLKWIAARTAWQGGAADTLVASRAGRRTFDPRLRNRFYIFNVA